jgi:hypothetical protein
VEDKGASEYKKRSTPVPANPEIRFTVYLFQPLKLGALKSLAFKATFMNNFSGLKSS